MSKAAVRAAKKRVVCPYCDHAAVLVYGERIYPHRADLLSKPFWLCDHCDAWVGCHPGTTAPLGRIADARLRKAKQRVHVLLDPLWKSGSMKRKQAYRWLAEQLGIAEQNCHVGMFTVELCERACAALQRAKEKAR